MAGLADLLQWQGMGADQQPMQQPQQAPTSLAESITPDILAKLMEYIQGSVPQYQDDPQRPTDMQSLLISMGAGLMGSDDFGTGMSQGMSSFMQNRNILDQAQRGQNTERGMGTALGNYRAASALESLMGGSSSGKQPPDYAAFSESLKIDYPEFAQEIDAAVSSGDEVLIRGLRKHLANASGETDADAHDKFVREQEYKAENSKPTTYKPDRVTQGEQSGYYNHSTGEFSALPDGTEFFQQPDDPLMSQGRELQNSIKELQYIKELFGADLSFEEFFAMSRNPEFMEILEAAKQRYLAESGQGGLPR